MATALLTPDQVGTIRRLFAEDFPHGWKCFDRRCSQWTHIVADEYRVPRDSVVSVVRGFTHKVAG